MVRPLEGKTILVTGGGTRLGRALVEGLAEAGADVAIHYHLSQVGAREALAHVRALGGRAALFQANLARAQACEGLVEEVEASMGPLAVLVNSAALFERHAFVDTPVESLDHQWSLNARAAFLLSQAVTKRMLPRKTGDIINILDIGGVRNVWKSYSAYCMTKAALAALTECLALELAPHIRVNGVAPGTVLPPEQTSAQELESLRQRVPMGQLGEPSDIVQAVRFFLEGPRFITGQVLAVDGGRSLNSAGGRTSSETQ